MDTKDTKIDFLYLSEPDMIKAGVKDMAKCVDCMEDLLVTLNKGDFMMGGENHNSHGCMIMFPDHPQFPGHAEERSGPPLYGNAGISRRQPSARRHEVVRFQH